MTKAAGFTLLELLVVVLIIGVLAALAVANYQKSQEISMAESAAGIMQMVQTTLRMYFIDHPSPPNPSPYPAAGSFPGSGSVTPGNTCASPSGCGASIGTCGACNSPCDLVSCGYLADQDWGAMAYSVTTDASGNVTVARKPGGPSLSSGWKYTIDASGSINTNPSPCGGKNPPCVNQIMQ